MKRTLLAVLLALAIVPQASAAGGWLKSTKAAQDKAKKGNQLILVDLFADWCGWCKRFEQEVYPSEAFQKASDDMVLLRLNTEDGGEGTKFAQQYGVNSLPTFVLLNSDMTIAGMIKGYAPPVEFARILRETVAKNDIFRNKLKNESSITDAQARLDFAHELTQRQSYPQSEIRLKKLTSEKGLPMAIRSQAFYELAVSQLLQQKYDAALTTINTLGTLQKSGEALERSRLLAGQIKMERGDLTGAADEFRKFKAAFPSSPLVRNVDMVLPDLERRIALRR